MPKQFIMGAAASGAALKHPGLDVAAGGVTLPVDAQWSSVKLLIQPHEGDDSTEGLTDRGPDGRTPTVVTGSVAVTDGYAASPIFGAILDPAAAEVSYSDDAGLQFGTGDFCIEWIERASGANTWSNADMFGASSNSSGPHHFAAYTLPGTSTRWYMGTGSWVPGTFTPAPSFGADNGGWAHWAFERASGVMRCFFNGREAHSVADTLNYDTNWDAFTLFTSWNGASGYRTNGMLRALRFTHASRYGSSDFVPPAHFPESG